MLTATQNLFPKSCFVSGERKKAQVLHNPEHAEGHTTHVQAHTGLLNHV